jgi:ADP-ribose pyrophosphatase YjhB (NUDIX family)
MDPGESVTECCEREVWEETGLRVRVTRLIGVYTNPHVLLAYPDGNRWQIVALFFAAAPVGGALRPSDETTDVGYFSQAEAGQLDIHEFDRQRIADAFAGQDAAFVRDDILLG